MSLQISHQFIFPVGLDLDLASKVSPLERVPCASATILATEKVNLRTGNVVTFCSDKFLPIQGEKST